MGRLEGAESMLVAAIDCGTNTIRLWIGTKSRVKVRKSRMVRLGEDLDRTGRISEAAMERAFAAIDEYATLIAKHKVKRIRFCATSATRDASNSNILVAGVKHRLGISPEVISGDEEARLTYLGAVSHMFPHPKSPVLVVDIGGGSTELVTGSPSGIHGISLDIGSVRLHERHLQADPPKRKEIAACVEDIDAMLDECPINTEDAVTVIGVGGTVTTIGAGVTYPHSAKKADKYKVRVADTQDFIEDLLHTTVAERRELPYINPGRADVIGAGALILSRVLDRTNVKRFMVSRSDILDGIAGSILH